MRLSLPADRRLEADQRLGDLEHFAPLFERHREPFLRHRNSAASLPSPDGFGAAGKLGGHLRSEGIDRVEHKRPIDLPGRVRSLFVCDGVGMHFYRWFQRPRE